MEMTNTNLSIYVKRLAAFVIAAVFALSICGGNAAAQNDTLKINEIGINANGNINVYYTVPNSGDGTAEPKLEDIDVKLKNAEGEEIPLKFQENIEESGTTYALLIDISLSNNAFSYMIASLNKLVDNMGANDVACIYSCGEKIERVCDYTSDKGEIKAKAESLRLTDNYTKLYGAIEATIQYTQTVGANYPTNKAMILYSDGFNCDPDGNGSAQMIIGGLLNSTNTFPIYALQFDTGGNPDNEKAFSELKEVCEMSGGAIIDPNGSVSDGYDIIANEINSLNCIEIMTNAPSGDYELSLSVNSSNGLITATRMFHVNSELSTTEDLTVPEPTDDIDAEEAENTEDETESSTDKAEDEPENEDGQLIAGISNTVLYVVFGLLIVAIILLLVLRNKGTRKVNPNISYENPPQRVNAVNVQENKRIVTTKPVTGGVKLVPFMTEDFGEKHFSINDGEQIIVGSDSRDCDIAYDMITGVKSIHMAFEKRGKSLFVFPADNTAIVNVNGYPVKGMRELRSGDIVAVGGAEVTVLF